VKAIDAPGVVEAIAQREGHDLSCENDFLAVP